MMNTAPLFDRAALQQTRRRALQRFEPVLQNWAADEMEFRLETVNRPFQSPAIVTPWRALWQKRLTNALITQDETVLTLEQEAHDVVLHALCLHSHDDPLGQLIQCRRALKPDGLFLATMFGGETLAQLRHVLLAAEADLTGGAHQRVAPMAGLADMAGLLGRAGFALPVADRDVLTLSYPNIMALAHDLRRMGETNITASRARRFAPKQLFARADALWPERDQDGRLLAHFEIFTLTGWAPSADQPQPLRPGSALQRLSAALQSDEEKLPR